MLPETTLRISLFMFRAASLAIGGLGVFALWASFQAPAVAAYAILSLSLATGMTVAMPKTV